MLNTYHFLTTHSYQRFECVVNFIKGGEHNIIGMHIYNYIYNYICIIPPDNGLHAVNTYIVMINVDFCRHCSPIGLIKTI